MDAFLVVLTAIREWLTAFQEQQPWLTPVLVLVCIVLAEITRRNVSKSHRIRQKAEDDNERLEADLKACRSALKRLKERLPETTRDLANRKLIEGSEESAVHVLRHHMDTEGARLSEMAQQIAHFHLGLVSGRDRDRHLVPAERFALLAFHLDPRHGEAGELLREIQRLRGDPPFEHVLFTDDVAPHEDDSADYYVLPRTREAVASLLGDAERAIKQGHYRHALALAHCASLVARRWPLGERERFALVARYWRATALQHLSRYKEALDEIDGSGERPGILPLYEQSQDFNPADREILITRWLRANILDSLGRYKEALDEIDGRRERPGILPLYEQSQDHDPNHQYILITRWLRTSILRFLGRHEEALAEIDGSCERPGILSLYEQSQDYGPKHSKTLNTRGLRADILRRLGRYEEALAEIDGNRERLGVLPLYEQSEDHDPKHPYTLIIRWLRAYILDGLGRYKEALAEIEGEGADRPPGILSLYEQSRDLGPKHLHTLMTRWLRADILRRLGRYDEALAEIDGGSDGRSGILSLYEQSPDIGAQHPETLSARLLRAQILDSLGRCDEALAEIDDGSAGRSGILSLYEQSPNIGAQHPETLSARLLRAQILKRLGRCDEALAEDDGEYSGERRGILSLHEQNRNFGSTHPSTLSARSLRGAILSDLGRHEESERELRSVGTALEAALGPVHNSTLRSRHRLATTLVALNRLSEAQELLRTVTARRRDSLGDEHPDTRAATDDLDALRRRNESNS